MRVLAFGTYDSAAHPRIRVIIEGLRAAGVEVDEVNVPLGLDTAAKVALLQRPWRLPLLAARLADRWWRLARQTRKRVRPDAVLVGYLGHFDVHLARLLFTRRSGTPIVLDHLIGASDTASDRRVNGGLKHVALRGIDAAALRRADVIVVDTDEHLAALPDRHRARGVVINVGAPEAWFHPGAPDRGGPLRVIFFGLYTPLQGAPVIGAALRHLAGEKVEVTMVGTGQDRSATRDAAGDSSAVRWLDWVPADELPHLVAAHDVCLGIFGTSGKALRVVPNKVFQGAAAGCAIITSDTPPQRRAMGDAAVYVPAGDAGALADAVRRLAADRAELARRKAAARERVADRFSPSGIVRPLIALLARPKAKGLKKTASSREV
jgi:glycosyltransferase involved in cell wall biosynthesis